MIIIMVHVSAYYTDVYTEIQPEQIPIEDGREKLTRSTRPAK